MADSSLPLVQLPDFLLECDFLIAKPPLPADQFLALSHGLIEARLDQCSVDDIDLQARFFG
jgi:hypothetical protein